MPPSQTLHIDLPTPSHTYALGVLLSQFADPGDAILLHATLGAGKTTLARGYIRGFVNDPRIPVTSPTYLLDNVYADDNGQGGVLPGVELHHMDLWRLEGEQRGRVTSFVDWPEILRNGVCLVEWPDRLPESFVPGCRLDIFLEIDEEKGKVDTISPRRGRLLGFGPKWKEALTDLLEECEFDEIDEEGELVHLKFQACSS